MGRRYKGYERKTIKSRKQAGNMTNGVYEVEDNCDRAGANLKFQRNAQPSSKKNFIMKNRLVIELNDYMTLTDKHKCFLNIEPSENCFEYSKSMDEAYSVIKNVTLETDETGSKSSSGKLAKCASNQSTAMLNEVLCGFLPESPTTTKLSFSPTPPKYSVSFQTTNISQKSITSTERKQILLFRKPFVIKLKPVEKVLTDDDLDLNIAKNSFLLTSSSLVKKEISNYSCRKEKSNPLLSKTKHDNSKNDFTNFIKQEDLEDSFFNIKEEHEEDIIDAIKQESSVEMYPMELKTIGSSDFEYFDEMDAQEFFDSEILGI